MGQVGVGSSPGRESQLHRVLVIQHRSAAEHKFVVVADSDDADVSDAHPREIPSAGGTAWEEFDDSTGFSSPYATIPCEGSVSSLGYWHVNATGKVLDYDFAAAGLSERKVITSGELHAEFDGHHYVARAGDSMIFLVDPNDRVNGAVRPFPVRFLGDKPCSVVYTEYALP